MLVSVVIPTLDEAANIGRCLDSLLAAAGRGTPIEITCVDNGSQDRTVEIVRSHADRLPVQLLVHPGATIAAQRNMGAARSQGEILAFLDADCTVPEGWFASIVHALSDPAVAAVGCSSRVPEGASWIARTWDLNVGARRVAGEVATLPSCGLAVSRKRFEGVGGFDDRLVTNEDFDLCYRLRHAGGKVVSHPELSVVHWGVPGRLRDFFRRERWHGTHVFRVFLTGLPQLKNAKVVLYAAWYAVAAPALPVAAFFSLAGGSPWLLAAAAALLVLPAYAAALATLWRTGQSLAHLPRLGLIYAVYGLARAASLFDVRNWRHG